MANRPDDPKARILESVKAQIEAQLKYRPDVSSVLRDLDAIKNLKGGPADATAFHDFNVLQIAFENVWVHAFDQKFKQLAGSLYTSTIKLYADAGLEPPPLDALSDVEELKHFLYTTQDEIRDNFQSAVAVPVNVQRFFPNASSVWWFLSYNQQNLVYQQAEILANLFPNISTDRRKRADDIVERAIRNPEGQASKLEKLILEMGIALSEPYAFDVFAPNSYNFGLMLTYRQKWVPGPYQAGDLRASIPLAPGETRKYTTKKNVKQVRAEKELEKSMSSRSDQSSIVSRAEAEIMKKATTATNFKMTASGSFNIGVGSIDASTEFALNQALESASNKKEFHEATIRAAEEYRLERSLEIDTSSSVEMETTTSGEISNPNNELTVTYLFYELQRRYRINEFIYRARPVILVAQDVPAPHEIDEAWLIKYQWILARVLLDDGFRPSLTYLISGLAGDQISLEVIKAHWDAQKDLAASLEAQVNAQLYQRDYLREVMVQTSLRESLAESSKNQDELQAAGNVFDPKNTVLPGLTGGLSLLFGGNPQEKDLAKISKDQAIIDTYEANRKATQTRLQYVEDALADAQNKLSQAKDSYEKATQQYSAALQQQYNRKVAIDQLRVHVKQNIFYYMQAIWDQEPADQRFFRLYKLVIQSPQPVVPLGPPILGDQVALGEIADLDHPLGYKGNYMIFPLKKAIYLTTYMLQEFIDDYAGVKDPDAYGEFDIETFDQKWRDALMKHDPIALAVLHKQLTDYLSIARRSIDEIIVPTGQLFIEALTGSHPLLEDFKLLHRVEDVRKVKAEVRHAELENLRLAARLAAAESDANNLSMLEDPDIEKKVIIEGNASVQADTN